MLNLILGLLLLLSNTKGCRDEPEQPTIPTYSPSGQSSQLKNMLSEKTQGLMGLDYEDWMKRFTTSTPALETTATGMQAGLIGKGYAPTSYEDFLKRFTPEQSDLMTGVLGKYQGLLGETYDTEDYSKTEQDYLESVLGQYKKARGEALDPLRERYISEGLYESGPGFKAEREFGEETATGIGDISKQWAYEGIQRKQQAQQYQDALKRGDYSTMYNLALSEEQRAMKPVYAATETADAEKRYYDALQRGDIETAFNMAQILRQTELQPKTMATEAESGALGLGSGLYGQVSAEDLARYKAAMQGYGAQLEAMPEESDLGGIGSGLGMLAGLALAPTTGGMSLMYPLIGGSVGGGIGKMIRY